MMVDEMNNNGQSEDPSQSEVNEPERAEKPSAERKKGFFRRKFEEAKEGYKERQRERKQLRETEREAFKEERKKSAARIGMERAKQLEKRKLERISGGGAFSNFAKSISTPPIDVGGQQKKSRTNRNGSSALSNLRNVLQPTLFPSSLKSSVPDVVGFSQRTTPSKNGVRPKSQATQIGPSQEQRKMNMMRRIDELTGNKHRNQNKTRVTSKFF